MTRGCQYKDPNWLNGTLDFGLWTLFEDGFKVSLVMIGHPMTGPSLTVQFFLTALNAKLDGLGLDKEIVLRFVDLAMTIITEQNFMIKD